MNLFIKIKLKRPVNNEKLEKHTQPPVRVHTCMQPDLSQGHPGVQGSLLGGTALQGRRDLGQSLFYSTRSYRCGVNWTWVERIMPLHTESPPGSVSHCLLLPYRILHLIQTAGFTQLLQRTEEMWTLQCLAADAQFLVLTPKLLIGPQHSTHCTTLCYGLTREVNYEAN